MKALLYSDWEKLVLTEVPDPKPQHGEVLLKVDHVGICGSELECVVQRHPRRKPPLIMGHEFAGTIVVLGDGVDGLQIGQKVVVNPIIACRLCRLCRIGKTNLCERKQLMSMHRQGAFAEFVAVPAVHCYPLPYDGKTKAGAMTEPVANAVHAVRLAGEILPERVFVFGAGTIGLVCVQVAKAMGASFVAVAEIVAERLAIAQRFADATVNPVVEDVLAKAKELTDGLGFDLTIDAVGRSETRHLAVELLHPTGVAIWLGLHGDETTVSGMNIVNSEKRIQGSYAYTEADFATAFQLVTSDKLDVTSWVHEFPLDEGVKMFWELAKGQAPHIIKALLCPSPSFQRAQG